MEKNSQNTSEAKEISLQRLLSMVLQKGWLIALVSVLCAVLTFLGTYYLIQPKYQSSAMFYVNNNSVSIGDVTASIDSGDIVAAKSLVQTYIVVLNSRETVMQIIDYAGVNRSYTELRNMMSAAAVNSTEIFRVVVTSEDPKEAQAIANAITQILPNRIDCIIDGTTAKVVDSPILPTAPSSPNYTQNTVIGFLLGMLLSMAGVVLYGIFDVTIRDEEDVEQTCPHPVLAAVPDMLTRSKGGYYYGSSGKQKKGPSPATVSKEPVMVGGDISFAASEAYKLLRTKLQFSFVDENDCHIIGVSSALAGEGKSLSSVNLAYSLAQLEKRVLLIDCDLRRPSLAAKLPIQKVPGLSNYLTRQVQIEEIIQKYSASNGECAFDVISSGRNPPNPIELISSARMEKMLTNLRNAYDYIILDLPPVGEVSDALVAAKLADGMLLVVRQDYCNRTVLKSAVDQLHFGGSRILGVVLNCTTENSGYARRYKSYKRYYSRYEGSYVRAAKRAAADKEK